MIADPGRRRLLDLLLRGPAAVGDLVDGDRNEPVEYLAAPRRAAARRVSSLAPGRPAAGVRASDRRIHRARALAHAVRRAAAARSRPARVAASPSLHQSCTISASRGSSPAPNARYSTPSGPASTPRIVSTSIRIASIGPDLDDLVLDLDPGRAAEHDVHLFLALVLVPEGDAEVRGQGEETQPKGLALEGRAGKARLDLGRHAEVRRLVLDLVEILLGVVMRGLVAHARMVTVPGQSETSSVRELVRIRAPRSTSSSRRNRS